MSKLLRTRPGGLAYKVPGLACVILLTGLVSTATAFQLFKSPHMPHDTRAWAIADSPEVKHGESFNLYVRIALGKGWHMYSLETPKDGEDLATVINIEESVFSGQEDWKEPDPEIILDQALNKIVKTHQGTVEFRRSYLVPVDLKPGIYPVRGSILFRACDNRVCTLPNEIPFNTQVTVGDGIN